MILPAPIDLSGPWRVRADPGRRGEIEKWWERPDWEDAQPILVPGAWQLTLGPEYHDVAWYHRRVELPRLPQGARAWLRFRSVATDATVWVNGARVGRNIGDYAAFHVEFSPAAGQADIVVRVDEMHASRPKPGVLTENGHITKGFHDVLSLQHGGIWDDVSIVATGELAAIPDGVHVRGELDGRIAVIAELEPHARQAAGQMEVEISLGQEVVARAQVTVAPESRRARADLRIPHARTWTPARPTLYSARVRLTDARGLSDAHEVRFGLRRVEVGGADGRRVLLNGQPIQVRGVLHWGHEKSIAPSPPESQVRAEFTRLREMGFNCVCLCMWYPPESYFRIADEMGMLVWQEHPLWKSPMEDEHLPAYRAMFERFFRRDRRHTCVVIVSGSCEHERFNPDLADWWWEASARELHGQLRQVQTAFIAWTNPSQTDAFDEHVYESSGRWIGFLRDVRAEMDRLPPKPLLMGETVIGTSWIDTRSMVAALGDDRPWWAPRGLDTFVEFERGLAARFGEGIVDRLSRQADSANLASRKFQVEAFRENPWNAGLVMNQIADVPVGRLGFMDDLGRWRFAPEQTRDWLGDVVLLLRTPDHRRAFVGGVELPVEMGLSNFSSGDVDAEVRVSGHAELRLRIRCTLGEAAWVPASFRLPEVDRPTRIVVEAQAALPDGSVVRNTWPLWVLPTPRGAGAGVFRVDGLAWTREETDPDFEERAYSSGWGLPATSWRRIPQHPETVLFKCPLWRFDAPRPSGALVALTHVLTPELVGFMARGGRCVLLATPAQGGLRTRFIVTYGQAPLVIERPDGPIRPGESDMIVDLLHHDLTRRHARAIPVEELGPAGERLVDHVDPIVRLLFTHDQARPLVMDAVFSACVGEGVLIATSLDHTEDAGRWLLERLLNLAGGPADAIRGRLSVETVRSLARSGRGATSP